MTNSGDQLRLQSLQTNAVKHWKPKETVILPDDFSEIMNSSSSLKTSETLSFLKEEQTKKPENIFENGNWDLNDEKGPVSPLKFSNGKTQTDIVNEILELIKRGTKTIFLHGACGTGKSAIALNIARKLGKSSIIVPVKALQRQYEDDYTTKNFYIKRMEKE